jgi:hypothetical protein
MARLTDTAGPPHGLHDARGQVIPPLRRFVAWLSRREEVEARRLAKAIREADLPVIDRCRPAYWYGQWRAVRQPRR